MCVHSLCDIVFHAVTHYEFDANLIRSGIIHERCERVPAIMGKMFHVELIHNCIEIRTNIGTVCVVIAIFVVYQKSTVGIVPVLYERQDFVCNRITLSVPASVFIPPIIYCSSRCTLSVVISNSSVGRRPV